MYAEGKGARLLALEGIGSMTLATGLRQKECILQGSLDDLTIAGKL